MFTVPVVPCNCNSSCKIDICIACIVFYILCNVLNISITIDFVESLKHAATNKWFSVYPAILHNFVYHAFDLCIKLLQPSFGTIYIALSFMGGPPVQIGRARISFNSPQAPLASPLSSLWKECIERFPNPLELFQPVLEERDSSAMSISEGCCFFSQWSKTKWIPPFLSWKRMHRTC